MFEPNRLSRAIEVTRKAIEALPAEKREAMDKTLALSFREHFDYQQLQARAHVTGDLTTDEAQIVYVALGEYGSVENGGWASGTDTATKYAVTLLVQHLLEERMSRARR